MFERFTPAAVDAIKLAQDEARTFRHNYIGTEHILLGVLRAEEGRGTRVLAALGVSVEGTRERVRQIIGFGERVLSDLAPVPFTPRAKRVLEGALREALSLGHNHIGTEHLLLGLGRENEGVAARILTDLGVEGERLRERVMEAITEETQARQPLAYTPLVERALERARIEAVNQGSKQVGGEHILLGLARAGWRSLEHTLFGEEADPVQGSAAPAPESPSKPSGRPFPFDRAMDLFREVTGLSGT